MSFTLIENSKDLGFLDKELIEKPFIGIDTEFRRRSKEEVNLALMQINDGYEIYLVDCISIGKYEGFCKFLFNKNVLKIFHSCREDLEVINSWTKEGLKNIFDTQLANAFLGGSFSVGYQELVNQELDVKINKTETRSNWIRRPLRDAQLKYAATDVQFLLELYETQLEDLERQNKLSWMEEEMSLLLDRQEHAEEDLISIGKIKLTKSDELQFLKSFNKIIVDLSESLLINRTLLFSKKSQKQFLYICLNKGPEEAFRNLQSWKKGLLIERLMDLIEEYKLIR